MKKIYIILLILLIVTGCTNKESFDENDVSNMVYVGTQVFETQEIGEFKLTELGIPYVVMEAGTTNYKNQLATIDSEYMEPENDKTGFYVNKDETIVLKVYTYQASEDEDIMDEKDSESTQDLEETPEETSEETPEETISDSSESSGYQEIYDKWAVKIIEQAPNVGITELAEITNEGVSEMAEYMLKARGKDGQYETYEEWAGKLMDLYLEEAR